MKIVNRIKKLITSPGDEWVVIADENHDISYITKNYLLILILIPVVALVIGWEFVGKTETFQHLKTITSGWDIGLQKALIYLFTSVITIFTSTYIINKIAPVFRVERNFNHVFRLIVYSWTPILLAGIFYLLPALSFMFFPGLLFSFVLIYYGLDPLMKPPAPAKTVYFTAIVAVVICCFALTHLIIKAFFGVLWINNTNLMPGNFVL